MSGAGTDGGLRGMRVRDAMAGEIVTCTAEAPLAEVAALMAGNLIHSVVVLAPPATAVPGEPAERWSILSDLDLMAGAYWSDESAGAGAVAASPRVVLHPDDSLAVAALAMARHAVSHVPVAEPGAEAPLGILSALDIARVMAPRLAGPPLPALTSAGGRHPRPGAHP
ncbi:MAG: CBS domain-containing protein [Miltoncostaeaceae bacterium]